MPDLEDLTDGSRFAASVPARHEPFPIKGGGALDWGMQSRLARVIRPATGRTAILAIDHAYSQGPTNALDPADPPTGPLLPNAEPLTTTSAPCRTTIPPP